MAATMTVTGTAGPGKTVSAQVFENVLSWTQDCVSNVLSMLLEDAGRVVQIDITAATTYTVTKSGSTYTVTIS